MAFMQPWSISIGVAAVVIAVVVGLLIYGRAHTQHLRERFGFEYDRRVAAVGNRWRAESELAYREARVEEIKNHPLNESDRAKFMRSVAPVPVAICRRSGRRRRGCGSPRHRNHASARRCRKP